MNDVEGSAVDSRPHPPLVSVIIPNYNKGTLVRQAIDSVYAQTYPQVECIVLDDGSTDEGWAVIEACAQQYPSLKALRQENTGLSVTRDRMIGMAQGEWILPLDSDDFLYSDALAELVTYAQAHPEYGVIYSNYLRVDPEGQMIEEWRIEEKRLFTEGDMLPMVLMGGIVPVTALIRRDAILSVGGYSFNSKLLRTAGHDDYALYMRLMIAGHQFGHVKKPLWAYRDMPNSLSKGGYQRETERYKVLLWAMQEAPERVTEATSVLLQIGLEERRRRKVDEARLEGLNKLLRRYASELQAAREQLGMLPEEIARAREAQALAEARRSEMQAALQRTEQELVDARVALQRAHERLSTLEAAMKESPRSAQAVSTDTPSDLRAITAEVRAYELQRTLEMMQRTRGFRLLNAYWRLKRRLLGR